MFQEFTPVQSGNNTQIHTKVSVISKTVKPVDLKHAMRGNGWIRLASVVRDAEGDSWRTQWCRVRTFLRAL